MRERLAVVICSVGSVCALAAQSNAPAKLPPTAADYGPWEVLVPQPRAGLSPDGQWVAYGINRSNRENELRVTRVADRMTKTAAFGSQPVFSADSRWVAYAIGYSESQEDKLRREKKPVQRKLGVLNLEHRRNHDDRCDRVVRVRCRRHAPRACGAIRTENGKRGQPPLHRPADDGARPRREHAHRPRSRVRPRCTTFGNVSEFAWQDKGPLLALTINAEDRSRQRRAGVQSGRRRRCRCWIPRQKGTWGWRGGKMPTILRFFGP